MAAISTLGVVSKTSALPFRSPIVCCTRQVRRNYSAALVENLSAPLFLAREGSRDFASAPEPDSGEDNVDGPEWKKLSSKELGITNKMISKPTKLVLNGLKKKGYQVYLVGGCVRDLILKRPPKDFDIITSANLYQVMRTFARCQIVGRRFPICHVYMNDCIVEVSSFKTSARNSSSSPPSSPKKRRDIDEFDYVRWKNCLGRDFTINGLMFDPYSNLIYDYIVGLEDIKKAKVRTVIPSQTSFQEDCARILRAIRIAARLGFQFTRETALSIKNFSCTILRLDKSRLHMEMNYMLAYGVCRSFLEVALETWASGDTFAHSGFRRRDKQSNMLLSLFSNLDKVVAPNRPCHCCIWAAILAFHHALVDKPQDPMVVATFALAVHNGGDLSEAVAIARRIDHQYNDRFPELRPQEPKEESTLVDEALVLASSVKSALSKMTDEGFIGQAMEKYPQAPYSDVVLVSLQVFLKVCEMFGSTSTQAKSAFIPKRGSKIDYEKLVQGDLTEVRHVFARVVFGTVYPVALQESESNGDVS